MANSIVPNDSEDPEERHNVLADSERAERMYINDYLRN
jgi:hypothetical protein